MALISVKTYHDVAIALDTGNGRFYTTIDETDLSGPELQVLQAKIDSIRDRQATQQRQSQAKQPILLTIISGYGGTLPTSYEKVSLIGLNGGRSSKTRLRGTRNNVPLSMHFGYTSGAVPIAVLASDDSRNALVAQHLETIDAAKQALTIAEQGYTAFVASLPQVAVPYVESKEEAIDAEPAFLEAVRAAIATA